MSSVPEFKSIYKRFNDALRYIMAKEEELKQDPKRWAKVTQNFRDRFERPMDEAWGLLPAEDKKRLAPLYLFRKAQQEPIVKAVMEKFDAKVVKVTTVENEK